jgi:uncharacterized protein YraI
MSRARRFASSLVPGLLLSGAALAQTAYTVREANVRAGPERDYPVVTRLAPGTEVSVSGCVRCMSRPRGRGRSLNGRDPNAQAAAAIRARQELIAGRAR